MRFNVTDETHTTIRGTHTVSRSSFSFAGKAKELAKLLDIIDDADDHDYDRDHCHHHRRNPITAIEFRVFGPIKSVADLLKFCTLTSLSTGETYTMNLTPGQHITITATPIRRDGTPATLADVQSPTWTLTQLADDGSTLSDFGNLSNGGAGTEVSGSITFSSDTPGGAVTAFVRSDATASQTINARLTFTCDVDISDDPSAVNEVSGSVDLVLSVVVTPPVDTNPIESVKLDVSEPQS